MPWSESTGMSESEYNKMVGSDLGAGPSYVPKRDVVNRPTRDLKDKRKDRAWSGGSRDF